MLGNLSYARFDPIIAAFVIIISPISSYSYTDILTFYVICVTDIKESM